MEPSHQQLDSVILPVPETGILLDFGSWGTLPRPEGLEQALQALERLEAGARANPDETGEDGQPGRRVGHYWLRAPERAPEGLADSIRSGVRGCRQVAQELLARFEPHAVLHLGIGGSALGPQLLAESLRPVALSGLSAASYHVLDNIDPDGLADHLHGLDLARTLVVVVSKSGSTTETRGCLERVRRCYSDAGVPFAPRAVALTCPDSALDRCAAAEGWAASLPVWTWVGGRTSLFASVGLLPAWLLHIDADELLAGAAAMDRAGREPYESNPAAQLAAAWHCAQRERPRAMVVLPYADRLRSLGRYLQQLVMESLGKRRSRSGEERRAGLVVYGNKGTTDQHAFVQQLRDGPDDFFACFLSVQRASEADPALIDGARASDLLYGFLLGSQQALQEDGKRSLQICLQSLGPRSLGALIALFERAVGLYAELLDINAYHQPGVQAGKLAASSVLEAQARLLAQLGSTGRTAFEIAPSAGVDDPLVAWRLLSRLAASGRIAREGGAKPSEARFHAL